MRSRESAVAWAQPNNWRSRVRRRTRLFPSVYSNEISRHPLAFSYTLRVREREAEGRLRGERR